LHSISYIAKNHNYMAAEQRHTITNPVGVDKLCQALQSDFAALEWLDTAYGRAFRNARGADGNVDYYPAVFINMGTGNYMELTPDINRDGNSVFFYAEQPTSYDALSQWSQLSTEVNAVLFADLRKVRPMASHRAVEEMKHDILQVLMDNKSPVYNIDKTQGFTFYEDFDSVYENYSYRELQKAVVNLAQYAVLRVRFTAKLNNC